MIDERTPEQRIIEALKKMTVPERMDLRDTLEDAGCDTTSQGRDLIRAIEDLGS